MRVRRGAVWLVLAAFLAAAAYVRLAPVDLARWHVDLHALAEKLADARPGEIHPGRNSAAVVIVGDAPRLQGLLAVLDRVALATARTRRIAGSVADGHVTWESRSLVWGFPDYTTAQIAGETLVILARSRFGKGDGGVNAARLRDWLSHL